LPYFYSLGNINHKKPHKVCGCLIFASISVQMQRYQKCYKMHCGVRLHGQNACYVIFWNIAPKHWIYMDRGYCNSFYFHLWLYNYWEYAYIMLWVHCRCILTETIKIYQKKFVGLKKIQSWYRHILYLKSTNCCMMNFFKFLISTIFSILYALLLQKHIQ
jgi:hypothetical protein